MKELSPESLVHLVYQLAKSKDELELAHLESEGFSLGAFYCAYNAVMLLAKENNIEAVEFLLTRFNLSVNYAVQGYAMGGHVRMVNQLIAQGASKNHAAKGFAIGGYVDEVNQLIAQGVNKDYAAEGFGIGGHVDEAKQLIAQGASRDKTTMGFAIGGHEQVVNQLIAEGANKNYAIEGYAISGRVHEVKELSTEIGDENDALAGFAMGGHVHEVNQLMGKERPIECALIGYAEGGHILQVKQLILQASLPMSKNDLVISYAQGGHVKPVNELIAQGASPECALSGYAKRGYLKEVNELLSQKGAAHYADWAASSYGLGGYINEANLLPLMSFTHAQELRKCIAEKYIMGLLNLRQSTHSEKERKQIIGEYMLQHLPELMKRAEKLNQLMRENNLNLEQAKGYISTAANVWAFQGQQLVREGKIPVDIYFHIFSFINGCSDNDNIKIIDAANQKLRDNVVSASRTGWFSWFKTQDSLEKLEVEAEERYQNRMKPFSE
ncbi:hypothetical protein J2N86_14280 (plasmid) [Legionella lytica]|uniref:Ankyrin repeat protein n=1 Tax=Legionella lytica TaxID=96232 RepID=A0ABY4YD36_9GAMM|nr:hypothetical protein [Legionella lytica]USQ15409.1 hypothetical protein J2N86_14280 [Legionella lytica]